MGEEKVIVKEKDSTATGTDTELEKPDLTKIGKFCQRHGINSNLIMLKITLFVMYGGTFVFCVRKVSKLFIERKYGRNQEETEMPYLGSEEFESSVTVRLD